MFVVFKQLDRNSKHQFTIVSVIEDEHIKTEQEALDRFLTTVDPDLRSGHYAIVESDFIKEFDVEPKFDVRPTQLTNPTQPYPASA